MHLLSVLPSETYIPGGQGKTSFPPLVFCGGNMPRMMVYTEWMLSIWLMNE